MKYAIAKSADETWNYPDSTVFFMPHGDPSAFKNTVDNEMRLQHRNPNDPEQAPRPEPGDNLIIMATIIGVIVGCIAGGLIGYNIIGGGAVVHGILGGIIGGGILGASIGNYLKKRTRRDRPNDKTPEI